ncbi:MAG TPA: DUF202 domain-containing protein [Chitinophagaceae bacterium]|nr:DUF202 domain-containing protein [Chitinophagaceae bacterium]
MDHDIDKGKTSAGAGDHLANERTYLAWIRTSIGIMAFGFVVVKFTLFLKQLSAVLGKKILTTQPGYTAIIGIFLVGFGACLALFSFLRYKHIEKQLLREKFRSSNVLTIALTLAIVIIGLMLMFYLIARV